MRTLLIPLCAVLAQLACGGERAYLIKGRVTTAAGDPLADAVVSIAPSCPARPAKGLPGTVSSEQGDFRLSFIGPKPWPTTCLRVAKDGFETQSLPLDRHQLDLCRDDGGAVSCWMVQVVMGP